MKTAALAIVAYRCEVGGKLMDDLDIQVRYFDDCRTDIEGFLRSEPTHSYKNSEGELVSWPFVRVLAIEEFPTPTNGEEVVGFITGCNEFPKMARNGT